MYKHRGGHIGARGGGRFGRGRGPGGGRELHGDFKKRDKTEVVCFKCRDKGHYAYECPQKKHNVNEVKENEAEIALTISKVPSEEDTEENETCVECDDQGYSDEPYGTKLKNHMYVKFYYSDDEDDEQFEVEEEDCNEDVIPEQRLELWPEEEMVNVTWKYVDDDEELSEDITEEEVDTEINSVDDVKVSNCWYYHVTQRVP